MLNVPVPEISLQRAGIDAPIGQLVPAGVSQHMRVNWKVELGREAKPSDQLAEACSGERRASLRSEDEGRLRLLLALQPAQGPQLAAGQGVNARRAVLGPVHVQAAMAEVDGVPPQRHQLGRPKTMPIRDQHHSGIAVAVAILPGGDDQTIDLGVGQVLAGADLGVTFAVRWAPAIGNCPVPALEQVRFHPRATFGISDSRPTKRRTSRARLNAT